MVRKRKKKSNSAQPQSSSQDSSNNAFELPPVEAFLSLPTFARWLPMACQDIMALKPYKDLYSEPCPGNLVVSSSGGPWFFLNHPINYVIVTGKVIAAEHRYYSDSGAHHYMFTLDDDTGCTIVARQIRDYKDEKLLESLQGNYVEAKGYVAQPRTGRAIYLRDIKVLEASRCETSGKLLSPFQRFLLANEEVLNVRRDLLCRKWSPQPEFLVSVQDVQDSPTSFCSFSRAPSCFEKNDKLFRMTISENSDRDQRDSGQQKKQDQDQDQDQYQVHDQDTQVDDHVLSPVGDTEHFITDKVSIKILAEGGLEVCGDLPSRKRVREDHSNSNSLRFARLPEPDEDVPKSKRLCFEQFAEKPKGATGPPKTTSCSAPKSAMFISPLLKSIVSILPHENEHLSYKNFERQYTSNRKSKSRKHGMLTITQRPPPSIVDGMIALLEPLLPKHHKLTVNHPSIEQLLSVVGSCQPYSEFVSEFSELLDCTNCLADASQEMDVFLEKFSQLCISKLSQLIIATTGTNPEGRVTYTKEMATFARDVRFVVRVMDTEKDLSQKLDDPDSELYEEVGTDEVYAFIRTGLDNLVAEGELIVTDDGTFVRPSAPLLEPAIRYAVKHLKSKRKSTSSDDISDYVRSHSETFRCVNPELIRMAVRKLREDTGLND